MPRHLIAKPKAGPKFMSSLRNKLSDHRQFLLAKIQVERSLIGLHGQQIRYSLSIVDRGLEIVSKLKSHPTIYLGLLTAVLIIKPRRLFSALKTGVFAWQIFERFSPGLNPKSSERESRARAQ